jgi:LysM repeat protein
MKRFILLYFLLPLFATAQDHLHVQGSNGNLYLLHKTAPKENYYSIGRIYNISPKEIAPYNKLALESGLSLGQEIKIPLKENFIQVAGTGADEVAVPVYHKTSAKESLSSISRQYNAVPQASLKAWNDLKSDALSPGQDIIIGYLKVKKDLSPLAANAVTVPAKTEQKPVVKVEETKPVVKEEIKPTVKAETKAEVPVVQKETVKPVVVQEKPVPAPVKTVSTGDKEGVFKSLYAATGKEENGRAGVFKSTSGWEDGKYYCLHNTAPQGSVVKITNAATGKFVYAKVLDVIPDLKQNAGMAVRLSNSAAEVIGAGANDFDCVINY